jgi:hypothetical protein
MPRRYYHGFTCLSLGLPSLGHTGMPSISLTEAAGARLDVISFFLVGFLLSALLLKWGWNLLAADFSRLPKLRYKHALGLLLVSSLFLYVVLTMISGARELMTPGAWVKSGATYQLATPERDPKPWLDSARLNALENLRDALWKYAREHDGRLPLDREVPEIPPALWRGIHPEGDVLAYIPGAEMGKGTRVVAYEPESFGPRRAVLMSDGSVVIISAYLLKKHVMQTLQIKP